MKNALMLHGAGCTPNDFWFPSIKGFLEKKGFAVFSPSLPYPESPELSTQLQYILNNFGFNEKSIVIGHSSGAAFILGILQNIDVRIHKAILVVGFGRAVNANVKNILPKKIEWKKIRDNAKDITLINSDNDPWGCDDKEGIYLYHHLGGRLIIHSEGHMGSDKFNQPYRQFPLLEKIIEL